MIYTGTCSWTEKSLIGSHEFYPKTERTAESRLRYYAEHFDTVEVDSTYYAIPNKSIASSWSVRTPESFIFHIKAYGALTGHGIDPKALPVDIFSQLPDKDKSEKHIYIKEPSLLRAVSDRFVDTLTPLADAGKLGVVVFQFPPWFKYKTKHLDYILSCKNSMGRFPVGVEFRHGSWLAPDKQGTVFDFLREHQLVYIAADEPQYGDFSTVPFIPAITSDMAYFRFHGRNKENWLRKNVETSLRYAYEYSDEELDSFAPVVKGTDKRAKATFVMFNNCHGSSAVKNALRMKQKVRADER